MTWTRSVGGIVVALVAGFALVLLGGVLAPDRAASGSVTPASPPQQTSEQEPPTSTTGTPAPVAPQRLEIRAERAAGPRAQNGSPVASAIYVVLRQPPNRPPATVATGVLDPNGRAEVDLPADAADPLRVCVQADPQGGELSGLTCLPSAAAGPVLVTLPAAN